MFECASKRSGVGRGVTCADVAVIGLEEDGMMIENGIRLIVSYLCVCDG